MIGLTGKTNGFSAECVHSDKLRVRLLSLIGLCASWVMLVGAIIGLPASTAHAQQLSGSDFSTYSAGAGNGWWSPSPSKSSLIIPHLLSTNDQTLLPNVTLLQATPELSHYRAISLLDNSIEKQSDSQLTLETSRVNPSSVVEGELLVPESFLSVLHSKYAAWESTLDDSEPRTSVHGLLVNPLLQVNYAGFQLPVSMYIPPLRGSDASR
jgi:hypothetical protein